MYLLLIDGKYMLFINNEIKKKYSEVKKKWTLSPTTGYVSLINFIYLYLYSHIQLKGSIFIFLFIFLSNEKFRNSVSCYTSSWDINQDGVDWHSGS